MKTKILPIIALLAAMAGYYFYINNNKVRVIDVHHNGWTASVIVDRLPYSETASIKWWLNNKNTISESYHVNADNPKGTVNYYVYAFGQGYKEEEKEDRLCFEDMNTAKNCIDKNLLMAVLKNRDGGTEFRFDGAVYTQTRDGKIIHSD